MKIRHQTIGDVIREKRIFIGLTQDELGEKVKLSNHTISEVENNKKQNPEIVYRLSTALNLNTKELVILLLKSLISIVDK